MRALIDAEDPVTARIDEALGWNSEFERAHGMYADTVNPSFPHLPDGWEGRLLCLTLGDASVRCLELHDLAVSKLAAGRLEDYELVAAPAMNGMLELENVRARNLTTREPGMRTILLARLQIVAESIRQA